MWSGAQPVLDQIHDNRQSGTRYFPVLTHKYDDYYRWATMTVRQSKVSLSAQDADICCGSQICMPAFCRGLYHVFLNSLCSNVT